ncbi:MAG TPA: purine-nucleoside phosphorylase [Candidatus Merdisoma merdipullorum]|nr:purine-nucleoside phosphorylase [Candidatus Merdisoma merdipullorum]
MNPIYEKLTRCYESIRQKLPFEPKTALVLGSGLGGYADSIRVEGSLDYQDIEGFPRSTVEGHKGRFVFGFVEDVPVVCMQGRVHYYEGYAMSDVVLPIRLMRLMGAETLFLTNAAGGINTAYEPGDLMLIRDHISSLVPSPLIGPNLDAMGPRFCDMTDTYDARYRSILKETARNVGIPLQEGVYIQFSGPQYETPAEIRMARTLGADAAGMSTACEAIAAHHAGMRVCGISCITNMAAGVTGKQLSHAEVQETADRVSLRFQKLVTAGILAVSGKS